MKKINQLFKKLSLLLGLALLTLLTSVTMSAHAISEYSPDDDTVLLLHGNGNFTDSSSSAHTVTPSGQSSTTTPSTPKLGDAMYFNGGHAFIADSEDFNFGTGDFTVDGWFKFDTMGGSDMLYSHDFGFQVWRSSTSVYVYMASTCVSPFDIQPELLLGDGLQVDTWYHFAVVREGNTFTNYQDGVQKSTTTSSLATCNANINFHIASYTNGSDNMAGYVDEFRISKGIARWTSNFTPGVDHGAVSNYAPTASNVSISGTLLQGEVLTGSYDYADGDSHPESGSTFRWLNSDTPTGTYSAISGATSSTYTLQASDANKYIKFEVTPNDGISAGDPTLSGIKGPVAGLAGPDANTVLLLHGDGDFTDSSSSAHSPTPMGSTSIITAQSKFGGESMSFASSTAGVKYPASSDFDFGAGDFTIDFWTYPTNNAGGNKTAMQVNGAQIYFTAGNSLSIYHSSAGTFINDGGVGTINEWQHYAVVRSGGNWSIYRNGTLAGSATNVINMDNSDFIIIGSYSTSGQYPLTGHLDEVRISKGIARWTSNFTPPTEAYGGGTGLVPSQDHTGSSTVTPNTSAGTASLDAGTIELVLDDGAKLDLSAGVASDSATTNNVGGTTIQAALNSIVSGGFSDANVDKVTLNSGSYGEDITISTSTGGSTYEVVIPDGTTMFAPTSWDGNLQAPTDTTSANSDAVSNYIASSVTQVGSTTESIIFDNPILIKLPGSGNTFYKNVGGGWTEVTETCNDIDGDGIVFPNHCLFVSGNTTYIWTYHMTEYGVFNPDTGAVTTEAQVEITPGIVTIYAPGLLDFGTKTVATDTQTVVIDMLTYSGGNSYLAVQDLRGTDSGFYATIEVGNLTVSGSVNKQIDAFNVYATLTGTNSTITKLDGLYGQAVPPEVQIPSTTPITHLHIDSPLTVLERNSATSPDPGILGKYGIQPKFEINIPKYQEIGYYSSTVTLTLTERE